MAPGPKKKSFHTPRNVKNTQNCKTNDKKNIESSNDISQSIDTTSNLVIDSDTSDNKKYSKRSVESNWVKYEEPQIDLHADAMRGKDFNVLVSYTGGSGSQLKLQDEKDWEDECLNVKDISINFQDLINSMKCIPFNERINAQNIFDEKHIMNFIACAEKWKTCYKPQPTSPMSVPKYFEKLPADPVFNIVEEPDSLDNDDFPLVRKFVVQDKTENIINSLASNLTFKNFQEKEETVNLVEEKKSETASNDLDFLLSLNISSNVPLKEENVEASKNTNVDDWLNSILDD